MNIFRNNDDFHHCIDKLWSIWSPNSKRAEKSDGRTLVLVSMVLNSFFLGGGLLTILVPELLRNVREIYPVRKIWPLMFSAYLNSDMSEKGQK